jgi:hypothetical protein
LHNSELYGDKAYQRLDAEEVRQVQNLTLLTPVKKQKGQLYSQTTGSMDIYRGVSGAATD